MAKPTKHAATACWVLTIIAFIGIIAGLIKMNPLITIILLVPTVIYEVYRTEGKSTTLASWLLLLVFAALTLLLIYNISLNMGALLGIPYLNIGSYRLPLGDVKTLGPIILAILAAVLLTRTRGRYTRWLAVVIIIASIAVLHMIEPAIVGEILALIK